MLNMDFGLAVLHTETFTVPGVRNSLNFGLRCVITAADRCVAVAWKVFNQEKLIGGRCYPQLNICIYLGSFSGPLFTSRH